MSPVLTRAFAWLGLVGIVAGLVLPVVDADHAGRSDPESAIGLSAHLVEHPVAHVGRDEARPIGEHCALCHWFRSLNHSTGTPRAVIAPLPVVGPFRHRGACRLFDPNAGGCAVRGPPSRS